MITNPEEYYSLLYLIQDKNNLQNSIGNLPPIPLPQNKPILKIKLDEGRKIDAPEWLSFKDDQKAETFFFEIDRFYEHIDLALTTCVIQYKTEDGKEWVYPVPFYDTVSGRDEGKMYIPWQVSNLATESIGSITYNLRFYVVDFDKQIVVFNLTTQSATSKILETLTVDLHYPKAEDIYPASEIEELLNRISLLEGQYKMYWLEMTNS